MGFKKVLGKIIPVAASVASSGLLGGGVAKSITDALGLGEKASDADIEAALAKASPEQLVKLKEIETQVTLQAEQLGFKRHELVYKDRDSARKREMAVKDSTPRIFAFITLGGFMALLLLVTFKGVPPENDSLIYTGLGALGTLLAQIGAYYFGSSAGSAAKDDHIRAITRKP